MLIISNNPGWWPLIDRNRVYSYFVVASCIAVIYDWALTFGQEVELIWRHQWSFMTLLYLGARYAAIPYAVLNILVTFPTVPLTDTGCLIVDLALNWMDLAMNVMLGIIMIARLHAMYQRSRKMLIFLIIIFLAVTIVCAAITIRDDFASGMELILSGTYICTYVYTDGVGETYWISIMPWVLTTLWEVLALCLAVWIAARHFYGLRGSSTGWAIGGWFTVLVQPHAIYAAVSCFVLGRLSTAGMQPYSAGAQVYVGLIQIFSILQMFVLGPRLILSIREYHAKTSGNSDAVTDMGTMAFRGVHTSTCGSL